MTIPQQNPPDAPVTPVPWDNSAPVGGSVAAKIGALEGAQGAAQDRSPGPLIWRQFRHSSGAAAGSEIARSPLLEPGTYSVMFVISALTNAVPTISVELVGCEAEREPGRGPGNDRIRYLVVGGFKETQPVRFRVNNHVKSIDIHMGDSGAWAGVASFDITLIIERVG